MTKKAKKKTNESCGGIQPCEMVATCFGVGKLSKMPGTLGSLVALPIWFSKIRIFFRYCGL